MAQAAAREELLGAKTKSLPVSSVCASPCLCTNVSFGGLTRDEEELVAAQMPAPSTRDAYEHFSAVDCQMSRGHGWGK